MQKARSYFWPAKLTPWSSPSKSESLDYQLQWGFTEKRPDWSRYSERGRRIVLWFAHLARHFR